MSCVTAPGQVSPPLCGTELWLVVAGCCLLGVGVIAIVTGVLIRISRRRRRERAGKTDPAPARPLSAWSAASSAMAPGTPTQMTPSRMPMMAQVTPPPQIRTPPRASRPTSGGSGYNQPYDPFKSPNGSGMSTPKQQQQQQQQRQFHYEPVEVLSEQQQQRRSRPRSDYERFVAQEQARNSGHFGSGNEDDEDEYGSPANRYEQRRLSFIPVYNGEEPQRSPPRGYGNRI